MPSHYPNQWWNIVDWTLRNKLQWKFKQNSHIFIQENASENIVCKMAAILSRTQCVTAMTRVCQCMLNVDHFPQGQWVNSPHYISCWALWDPYIIHDDARILWQHENFIPWDFPKLLNTGPLLGVQKYTMYHGVLSYGSQDMYYETENWIKIFIVTFWYTLFFTNSWQYTAKYQEIAYDICTCI